MSDVIVVDGWSALGYLLVGERIVAVDPGVPRLARRMVAVVTEQLRRPASDIAWAVATHYHFDHISGVPELMRLTGCRAAMPAQVRAHFCIGEPLRYPPVRRAWHMLTSPRHTKNPMPRLNDVREAPRLGLPWGNRRDVFPVDRWLDEGDAVPDAPGWTVLATPGHTPDSLCFWHEASRALISGDTVLGSVRIGAKGNAYCWSRTKTKTSLQRLEKMPVRTLYPGHGCVIEGENILVGVPDRIENDLW